ncbi:hypothetical protein LY78DRAFT_709444 [Colletotrichum sublineola]|nr:hypothetical protein LY78DRAFT_709444 [Colletotrichum sublineola]
MPDLDGLALSRYPSTVPYAPITTTHQVHFREKRCGGLAVHTSWLAPVPLPYTPEAPMSIWHHRYPGSAPSHILNYLPAQCRCWNSQPYALTFAPSRVNTPAVAHVGESGRPAQQIDYRRRAAQKSNGVYGQPPLQGPPNCVVTSPCCAGTWTAWLDGPGQASKFIAMSLWHRVGRRDPFGPVPSTSRD